MNDKLVGTIFDPATPVTVKVSRIASAVVIAFCAAMYYAVLAI